MLYQKRSFTLPTNNSKLSQTEYEIRVGLRDKNGCLVQPKRHLDDRTCPGVMDISKCNCGALAALRKELKGPALRTSKKS